MRRTQHPTAIYLFNPPFNSNATLPLWTNRRKNVTTKDVAALLLFSSGRIALLCFLLLRLDILVSNWKSLLLFLSGQMALLCFLLLRLDILVSNWKSPSPVKFDSLDYYTAHSAGFKQDIWRVYEIFDSQIPSLSLSFF